MAHLTSAQQREDLENETVTSATVKAHSEKKEKKKAQRKDTSVLKDNRKINLSTSATFMQLIKEIKDNSEVINYDFNLKCDKEDFEILMIYTKKLNRVLGEFTNFIMNLQQ